MLILAPCPTDLHPPRCRVVQRLGAVGYLFYWSGGGGAGGSINSFFLSISYTWYHFFFRVFFYCYTHWLHDNILPQGVPSKHILVKEALPRVADSRFRGTLPPHASILPMAVGFRLFFLSPGKFLFALISHVVVVVQGSLRPQHAVQRSPAPVLFFCFFCLFFCIVLTRCLLQLLQFFSSVFCVYK